MKKPDERAAPSGGTKVAPILIGESNFPDEERRNRDESEM